MDSQDLNLNHLRYFWMVAREGGVTKASQKLRVAQPTISAQVIALERALGRSLFTRQGQKLLLTEDGEVVLDYANQVFGSAQELLEVLRGRPMQSRMVIRLGVVDQVSKQIVLALMKEIQGFRPDTQVTIHEGTLTHILEELRIHALDMILSNIDVPADETGDFAKVQVGRLPILFVASPAIAKQAGPFPQALSRVPLLLPTRASPIWTGVEHFLNQHQIVPHILAEVQGVELLRLMALEGMGVAPLNPIAVAADMLGGRLVQLNPRPTGIYKTVWLIAKKRRRSNALMQHLSTHFRIGPASL
jgi:LysR family transcriptional activator of nhaA